MIDKKLYCETFSRLHASEEAKKEVFQMTKKKGARIPKLLRGAAIAAAMTMALAVTAGAVNIATDGEFFRQFTIVWTGEDSMRAVDAEGNEVYITTASEVKNDVMFSFSYLRSSLIKACRSASVISGGSR